MDIDKIMELLNFESLENNIPQRKNMGNPITLENCVNECYANDDFIKEFNRLNNSHLKTRRNPIGFEIDNATGKTNDDLTKFVELVDLTVYQPLILNILNDIKRYSEEPTLKNLQIIKNHGLGFYELVNNNWDRVAYFEDGEDLAYSYLALYDDNKNLFGMGRFKNKLQ